MKNQKSFFSLKFQVFALCFTILVYSCGRAGSDASIKDIEIFTTFAAEDPESSPSAATIFAVVDALNKDSENSGSHYEASGLPYNDYWKRLGLDLANGNAADVIMLDAPTNLPGYQKLQAGGTFLDLRQYAENSPIVKKQIGLEMGNYKGQLLSINAVNTNWSSFYYRKSIFEEAGIDPAGIKTWDDLLNVATQLTKDTDGDGQVDQFGIGFSTINAPFIRWWSTQFFWAAGGGWFQQDGSGDYSPETVNFDSAANLFTVKYLKKLRDAAAPIGSIKQDTARELFMKGVVAIMTDGSYGSGLMRGQMDNPDDLGVFKFPGVIIDGEYYNPVTPSWGLSWAIPKTSENPDGAFAFIETWGTPDIQRLMMKGQVPTNPDVLEEYAKIDPLAAQSLQWSISNNFDHVNFPVSDQFEQLDKVHQQAVSDALSGQKTPEEALEWGQAEMKRIMSE